MTLNVSAFGIQRKRMERVQGNKRYVILEETVFFSLEEKGLCC